jgi:ketosteroid isomerase-like protein
MTSGTSWQMLAGMPSEAASAELIQSLYAALAARDVDLARPLLDDDIPIEDICGSDPVPLGRGPDGLGELLRRYDDQFREFRIEPVEVVAVGEKTLVEVRIGGIGISGAEHWSTGYHVHTVVGGKLVRLQLFAERGEAEGAVEPAEEG